jgi:hypothetical protein
VSVPTFTAEVSLRRWPGSGLSRRRALPNAGMIIPARLGDSAVFRLPRADIQLNRCLDDCQREYESCTSGCGESVCRFWCYYNKQQCMTWGCLVWR